MREGERGVKQNERRRKMRQDREKCLTERAGKKERVRERESRKGERERKRREEIKGDREKKKECKIKKATPHCLLLKDIGCSGFYSTLISLYTGF